MHQTFDAALEINLLHANQAGADHNREHFDEWGITCLNLMSSPGAGKTVLLEKTLAALKDQLIEVKSYHSTHSPKDHPLSPQTDSTSVHRTLSSVRCLPVCLRVPL